MFTWWCKHSLKSIDFNLFGIRFVSRRRIINWKHHLWRMQSCENFSSIVRLLFTTCQLVFMKETQTNERTTKTTQSDYNRLKYRKVTIYITTLEFGEQHKKQRDTVTDPWPLKCHTVGRNDFWGAPVDVLPETALIENVMSWNVYSRFIAALPDQAVGHECHHFPRAYVCVTVVWQLCGDVHYYILRPGHASCDIYLITLRRLPV